METASYTGMYQRTSRMTDAVDGSAHAQQRVLPLNHDSPVEAFVVGQEKHPSSQWVQGTPHSPSWGIS
jgi:hypothetical protein